MKVIVLRERGGPEVLRLEEASVPPVRHHRHSHPVALSLRHTSQGTEGEEIPLRQAPSTGVQSMMLRPRARGKTRTQSRS